MSVGARSLVIGIELIDDPAWMGGTLYLRNLAICLSRLPASERPTVRLLGASDVVLRFIAQSGRTAAALRSDESAFGQMLRRLGWTSRSDPPIDLVYPGFGASIAGAVTLRWIPDFQHRYLPELFSAEEIGAREQSIQTLALQRGVVVLSSEVATMDFRKFYPNQRATPRVWHFCSLIDTLQPDSGVVLAKYGLPQKYLYLPNQFWAHKNHITVFRALLRLRQDHGMRLPLVCTGTQSDRRNERHFANLVEFARQHDLLGQLHFLGLVDRNEQIEILRHAAAVVQPSLFEGWSTVVEDVRATGRPIFLSDLPVHREQDPQRCCYFEPTSDAQLGALLFERWSDLACGPDARSEARAREETAARIEQSARTFCDIAEQAVRIARS